MELQQSPMLVYSAKWENQQEWMKNVHEEIWKFTSSNSSNGYNGKKTKKKHDMFMGLLDNNTMVSSPWLEWNIWDMIWLYFLTIIGELMDSCNGYFFYRH